MAARGLQRNASHEAKHHYSESEKHSYVDYINQIFGQNDAIRSVLTIPIDRDTDQLFQVTKEGVLMTKMINHAFPGTVNEKTLVVKPEKSLFEMTGNHMLGIQGCLDLGCSVVNIGPEDLVAGTPHLIMGLMWQVIKKSLLKQLNLASNPELMRLNDGEKVIEGMTPEQILLQWMNYHLKRAGHLTPVRNFGSDVEDSTAYAALLRQIDPDNVSYSDYQNIVNESDLLVRAEKVIECAKKVLGPQTSLFVSPDDIVTGNPRLNLAFTATLYNSHPALGPTEKELNVIEEEKGKIEQEKEDLKRELGLVTAAKKSVETRLEDIEAEVIRVRARLEQEKEDLKKQLDNEIQIRTMTEKELEHYKSQLELKQMELEKERSLNSSLMDEIEKLKKRIAELERRVKELEDELEALRNKNTVLMEEKEREREILVKEKNDAVETLTREKNETTERLVKEKEDAVAAIRRESEEKLAALRREKDEEISSLKRENDDSLARLRKEYEEMIAQLKAMHAKEINDLKAQHENKIFELREMIQKLQDLLPNKTEQEGWLVKQGGGRKNWLKRYFVLKTNFMCYYKDHKNLKHPNGVIDLVDCKVAKVPYETIKKKFCFEIATPKRTYFMQAESEPEIDGWIKAIESAKAKFKSDLQTRQSFLDANKEIKEALEANK